MEKVYYMAGVWDLFHVGHLNALIKARKEVGDNILIIGVVSDESAFGYKKEYPIIPFIDRMAIIQALTIPDKVVIQHIQFDIEHMKSLKVDEVLLGEDWADKNPSHLKKMMLVIPVTYIPRTKGISTTEIKKEINKRSKL